LPLYRVLGKIKASPAGRLRGDCKKQMVRYDVIILQNNGL
jgi:hypothetical protein